jgi:hypothetical protein
VAHDDEGDFAAVLQRILRASRENFRPVEGARIDLYPGRRTYFQSRVDLPGTTDCRIYETPLPVFSCQWKAPAAAPGAGTAGTACGRLADRVATALGPEWQRATSVPSPSKVTFRHEGRYRLSEVAVGPSSERSVCTVSISLRHAEP